MKVYCVEYDSGESYEMTAIFSSEESANKFCNEQNKFYVKRKYRPHYRVIEWEVKS